MRDVGSQLAEYFEAATERIAAEDVLAHVRVTEQVQRPVHRRLRPAWVAAAGFVGVLAIVGGALLAGVLLHDPSVADTEPVGTPVAEPSAGWGWWPLVVAGAAMIGVIVLLSRRLRRATKEVEMQTLDEKHQDATEAQTPRRSRRPWFVGLAILVVAAGAISTWAIVEANQQSDVEIAEAFADAGDIAWTTGDTEAWVAMFTEDGTWGPKVGREAISTFVKATTATEMRHGDVTEIDDGVFAFPWEAVWYGRAYTGEVHLTLEGDLISHAEVVNMTRVVD